MKEIFDAQFYVIFVISVIGLVFTAKWLRHVLSSDLADVVIKQYQNMFDKIDDYMEKFKELDKKVSDLKDKYTGLEEKAYNNKHNIEKILEEIQNLK
jgi:peptidoglycan hydrolase CwlO-like protein